MKIFNASVVNLKDKLRFPKSLVIVVVLVSTAFFSLVFQGCEKEDIYSSEYYEFLDVDLSVENYTPEQLAILEEAKNRIDKFVTVRKGKFSLSVKSGKEIEISEELYDHFLNMMNFSNSMISQNEYTIEGNKLVLNAPSLNPIRLKSGSLEYEFGSDGWQVQVDLMWYGADISVDDNYVKAAIGGTAIALIWCPEPLVTKILGTIAGIGATTYEIWGGNGITVHFRPWGTSYSFN
ncbi:hypothetical protein [Mangrovibacterium marinum]|uniref:hypothetical protein n=1 Tax=Mangrovibacterium marinum TaxID=1639118 RepID=UPI002A188E8F|nr:hypothetical protein [Mangrovibacterium marinum]